MKRYLIFFLCCFQMCGRKEASFSDPSHPFLITHLSDYRCRFGNQLLQYTFGTAYAEQFHLTHFVTPWRGQKLFIGSDKEEKLPSASFPFQQIDAIGHDVLTRLIMNQLAQEQNQAPIQNCQMALLPLERTFVFEKHQVLLKKAFEFQPPILETFQKKKASLLTEDNHLVVVHIRLGDYYLAQNLMRHVYVFPLRAYFDQMLHLKKANPQARFYLASDQVELLLPLFAYFEPLSFHDFLNDKDEIHPLDFDYFFMREADTLLISNSTLSFHASLFNEKASVCFRPCFSKKTMRPFLPWKEEALEKKPFASHVLVKNFEEDCLSLQSDLKGKGFAYEHFNCFL